MAAIELDSNAHLAVMGQVLGASPEAPFLAAAVKLEPTAIAALFLELRLVAAGREHESAA